MARARGEAGAANRQAADSQDVQDGAADHQPDVRGEDLKDPNLAFGWGFHILDRSNYAVLGLLLTVEVALTLVISDMVVRFTKTQEQGAWNGELSYHPRQHHGCRVFPATRANTYRKGEKEE